MKRREIIGGAIAALGAGALLLRGKEAKAQVPGEGAASATAIIAAIKEVYDEWSKVYEEYGKKILEYKKDIEGVIAPIKAVAELEDTLIKQKKWASSKWNQLLGFAKDPLGGTLPNLQREGVPIFQALDVVMDSMEKLFSSKEVDESKKQELSKIVKLTTLNGLSKNSDIQNRKTINAMKKMAGESAPDDKSAAEEFSRQSGVVMVELLVTINERLDQLVEFERLKLMNENKEYFGGEELYTRKDVEKAKDNYAKGEANISMPKAAPKKKG